MGLYQVLKNITFSAIDEIVLEGEYIELEDDYAKEVVPKIAEAFPDEVAILEINPSDVDEEVVKSSKKATKKKEG